MKRKEIHTEDLWYVPTHCTNVHLYM